MNKSNTPPTHLSYENRIIRHTSLLYRRSMSWFYTLLPDWMYVLQLISSTTVQSSFDLQFQNYLSQNFNVNTSTLKNLSIQQVGGSHNIQIKLCNTKQQNKT